MGTESQLPIFLMKPSLTLWVNFSISFNGVIGFPLQPLLAIHVHGSDKVSITIFSSSCTKCESKGDNGGTPPPPSRTTSNAKYCPV